MNNRLAEFVLHILLFLLNKQCHCFLLLNLESVCFEHFLQILQMLYSSKRKLLFKALVMRKDICGILYGNPSLCFSRQPRPAISSRTFPSSFLEQQGCFQKRTSPRSPLSGKVVPSPFMVSNERSTRVRALRIIAGPTKHHVLGSSHEQYGNLLFMSTICRWRSVRTPPSSSDVVLTESPPSECEHVT